MSVYGFAMLDMGYDFTQINPNWFDTMRVTKLPTFTDEHLTNQRRAKRKGSLSCHQRGNR
jgi:hypothetical protein